MNESMRCSIAECGDQVLARGWCKHHYDRWRNHGDPVGGTGRRSGDAERYFREVVIAYEGDECLAWPFSRSSNGYGQVWVDGKVHAVHRLVCEEVNGLPPTPEHEAAHKCGKGHESCCTKAHLVWKTHAENMADMFDHGTGHRKLSEEDVREILSLKGKLLHREIAARFGIHKSNVSHILRGKTWGWLANAQTHPGRVSS
ncbi:HNH endonuclease [Aminobacter anthyllidis]|uniref:HNH endonuclease n=1 Tax=Aminobacter anthyllidis TaxID=1035067 RepID=A0A9X1A6W7_9HYPH|nr:HNH endonuclease [Aminobacter anthyllidis]MBT1154359.1 HNH endonuclease [Aminobacter anthyllidis]